MVDGDGCYRLSLASSIEMDSNSFDVETAVVSFLGFKSMLHVYITIIEL